MIFVALDALLARFLCQRLLFTPLPSVHILVLYAHKPQYLVTSMLFVYYISTRLLTRTPPISTHTTIIQLQPAFLYSFTTFFYPHHGFPCTPLFYSHQHLLLKTIALFLQQGFLPAKHHSLSTPWSFIHTDALHPLDVHPQHRCVSVPSSFFFFFFFLPH